MRHFSFSRRRFLRDGTLLALSAPLWSQVLAQPLRGDSATHDVTPVSQRWLDGETPTAFAGVTWEVPWPQGQVAGDSGLQLRDAQQRDYPLQSWALARWPDGSLKWSAHALGGEQPPGIGLALRPVPCARHNGGPIVRRERRRQQLDGRYRAYPLPHCAIRQLSDR